MYKAMNEDTQNQLRAIQFGSREEIWEAAKQLSSLATETALSLTGFLKSGRTPEVRAAAAYTLGMSQYAFARESLEDLLNDQGEDVSVRGHAAEALGYIRSKDSVPVLLKHLKDREPGVKYWCIFALGQIRDARALSALKEITEKAEDEFYEKYSLRAEALDAIR